MIAILYKIQILSVYTDLLCAGFWHEMSGFFVPAFVTGPFRSISSVRCFFNVFRCNMITNSNTASCIGNLGTSRFLPSSVDYIIICLLFVVWFKSILHVKSSENYTSKKY